MSTPIGESPRPFRRAVLRAPAWLGSILLHLVLVAAVLIPLVIWHRPVRREPPVFRVIVADMARGDDAPKADVPGEGPVEAPEPVPEAPPPGPEATREAPPEAPVPSPAPPAPDTPPAPSPDAVAEALARLRQRPAVEGGHTPPAGVPGAGGVPHGVPGALGGLRSAAGRRAAVARAGGNGDSEGAVEAGLRWLARHQAEDGRWSGHQFHARCGGGVPCGDPGYITYDVGLTGLALAAFAGAGYGHREGEHAEVVRRGIAWLIERQDERGYFFRRVELRDMYNHACATLALAELLALTGDAQLRAPCARAVEAVVLAQQPGGGWTYVPLPPDGPRNDASIAGFCVQALASARLAGCAVPDDAFARAREFFGRQTNPATGWVRYADGGANDQREGLGMLAVGVMGRLLLGDQPRAPSLALSLHHLEVARPELDPDERPRALSRGHYAVYYGTLAAWLAGGDAWGRWNPAAANTLVQAQRTLGCARGSWDTAGKWAASGGRVYATALSLLTLQVYYKYPPAFLRGRQPSAQVAVPDGGGPAPDDEATARARELERRLREGGR